MLSRHTRPIFAFQVFVFLLVSFLSVAGQSRSLITTPIDNSSRAQVPHSHLPLNRAVDLGSVPENQSLERMILVLKMSPEQQRNLVTLLDSQQTKGSPNYHRWLTPEQYGQQFGPATDDVAQISSWLQQQGFTIGRVAKSGMWIEFSGNVGMVNRTFQTQLRRYVVSGENHVANATDISIPAALAPLVTGVSLHDFFSKPTLVRSPDLPDITNSAGASAVTPGDFATIYDLAPLYGANINGSGQTIAIVGRSDINLSDIAQFQKIFGLPNNVPTVIDNGIPAGVTPDGDGGEATLDTEWSAAVATGAKIVLVSSVDTYTTDGVILSAAYIVDQNVGQIVNASFSNCEPNLGTAGNAFWSNLWQQAAAQGMSVFVSAGDSGSDACAATGLDGRLNDFNVAVNGLSSTPFDTSIGGTEFDETVNGGAQSTFWNSTNAANFSSAIGYIPEMVWDDEFTGAVFEIVLGTGGGVSTVYPTPSWQSLNVTGLNVLKTYSLPGQSGVSPRGIPDVSLNASPVHDPYLFCFTSPFTPDDPDCQLDNGTFGPKTFQNVAGGTSFGSPTFAGIMALINQKVLNDHPAQTSSDGRQGLANYVLYPLAVAETFSSCNSSNRTNPATPAPSGCVFNDITVGNNNDPDIAGYNATVGYDLASGLGSIDASNLAAAWDNASTGFHGSETMLTTTAGNSISITHGQSITFDAAVQKLAGDTTSQLPVGSISLVAQGGSLSGSVGIAVAPLAGSTSPVTTGNFSTRTLPGGSYNLIADFPGDGFFASSVSNSIPVTVAHEPSITTLGGATTLPYGTYITEFNAIVAGASGQGSPSGQVTLADGGTAFAQLTLNNQGIGVFLNCPPGGGGIMTPTPSSLPCFTIGTHVITATYSGDNSFNPSPTPPAASQTLTLTITKGQVFPFLGFAASTTNPPDLINFPVILTASLQGVSPGAVQPTGSVQFLLGTTQVGQGVVTNGAGNIPVASSAAVTVPQGQNTITLNYSGDSHYSAESASQQIDNGVPIGWSGTTVTQTINAGQTATYNFTLSTATGFVGQVPLTCIAGTNFSQPGTPPTGVACTVSPTTADFTSSATSFPVTVTVTTTTQSQLIPFSLPWMTLPFAVAGIFALGLRKKKTARVSFFATALALSAAFSCGGGGSNGTIINPPPPPTTAIFTVWSSYPGSSSGYTVYNGVVMTTTINNQ
jgi:hypothetical protein